MDEVEVVWFRRDLRLDDHVPLLKALSSGKKLLLLYIWSPDDDSPWQAGGASRVWLHKSLESFSANLESMGAKLQILRGPTLQSLLALKNHFRISRIHAHKIYEPAALRKDSQLSAQLLKEGIELILYSGALLFDPFEIRTREDKAFQVFTPFWRACSLQIDSIAPALPAVETIPAVTLPESAKLPELNLIPKIRWHEGILQDWKPGEKQALKSLDFFVKQQVDDYAVARDLPADRGTSRLSAHLHFGEISIRRIWNKVHDYVIAESAGKQILSAKRLPSSATIFLKELGWREFAHHVLCNFPKTDLLPLRAGYEKFPWNKSQDDLERWQKGKTGYPIVDAGMRELWQTGWMHNRVRMIVASFLVKDLLISWQEGARWFWDTLVDADLANNSLGWQWSAGCGADAAPYFRIFNPVLQGKKFDPKGEYVRKWVPEIAGIPNEYIHEPWNAKSNLFSQSNVQLGKDYPMPIIDHAFARRRALDALATIRGADVDEDELELSLEK